MRDKKHFKKTTLTAISVICAMLIGGCGSNNAESYSSTKLEQQLSQVEKEVQTLRDENDKLKDDISKLKDDNEKLNRELEEKQLNKNIESIGNLTICDIDCDTLKPIYSYEITIDDKITLQEKIKTVADEISKKYFNSLPIEVVSISSTTKGQVAIINLKEKKSNSKNWIKDYFQGTTGAAVTSNILKENFLQKDYKGKWVDGIKFTYEGNEMQFDHIAEGFSDIIFRNN